MAAASVTLPTGVDASVAGPRRAFALPARALRQVAGAPDEPAAPELAHAAAMSPAAPRIPRGFAPPPGKTAGAAGGPAAPTIEAPTIANATPTPNAGATLAIAGLNPVNRPDIPPPPGSHAAGFSGGPRPQPDGGAGGSEESGAVTVPGLAARGGAKDLQATLLSVMEAPTSRKNLMASLHAPAALPPVPEAGTAPHATRAANPPDQRLAGRYVYTLAIQMPNVTSYSGSWMVWFAEHQPEPGAPPGDMRPPLATRKVDPKYIQAAADERVEGIVRLAAVIRRSGHVDSVELLRHLDERLDRSAEEALAKWEFEPAVHNGRPVDVDAVFEIPFRLAPKPKR
ncbi:MAG TPA: TonB family protein [Candidatus Sulfopaludibacter sp.]|nr:TonB family protein [Candidatus Sulfopaludibacter sp.]